MLRLGLNIFTQTCNAEFMHFLGTIFNFFLLWLLQPIRGYAMLKLYWANTNLFMRWYSQQMWFFNVKHLKIKVKKACHSMSDAQIQKPDLGWWQNPKSLQKSKTVLLKHFPEWFGNKTSQPIGCYDSVVIIQRTLMFSKNILFRTDFKVVWYTLMYFRHSEIILSSLGHIGTLAHH